MLKRIMIIFGIIIATLAIAAAVILSHPAFGQLPDGERLGRIEHSANYRNGSFQNRHTTPAMTGDKNLFQNVCDYLFNKPEDTAPDMPIPTVKTDLKSLDADVDLVVWLGHSSLFIQQDGKRILVDPVLTNEFPASLMLSPFKGTMIYSPDDIPDIDLLLITHDHWDHLDYGTVSRLRKRVRKIVCPLGVGGHFEYWKFQPETIVELDWNESFRLSDAVSVKCLPSRHFSGRLLTRNKTLWCGYMLEGSRNIYISGDGGYDTHFKAIAQQYGQIDLAVMENGQYSPNWKYIHLLPADLQKAVTDLSPRSVMTVHNSKFSLSPHPWNEPMEKFHESAVNSDVVLLTPMIGQCVPDSASTTGCWWQNL